MGIQSSKQVCTSVLEVCQSAEENGGERFDINDPLVETLHKFWDELPAEFKAKIKGHRAIERISRLNSSVGLSTLVQSRLTDWSSDVENLFKEDLIEQSISRTNVILNIVSCLSVLDRRSELDDIRWRICTVVLFRVKRQISSALCLSREDEQILLWFLMQLGLEENHQGQAGRWANIGERYESLALDLGGLGILATLPNDGGRDLWECRIPKEEGQPRKDSIRLLKEKGILKAAQAPWTTSYGETCANIAVKTIVQIILTRVDATGTVFVQQLLPLDYAEGPKQKDRIPRGRRASFREELEPLSQRKKKDRPVKRSGAKPVHSRAANARLRGITPMQSALNANHVTATGMPTTDKDSARHDLHAYVPQVRRNSFRNAVLEGNPIRNDEQQRVCMGEIPQQDCASGFDSVGMEQMLEQDLARGHPRCVQEMLEQDLAQLSQGGVEQMLVEDLTQRHSVSLQEMIEADLAFPNQEGIGQML